MTSAAAVSSSISPEARQLLERELDHDERVRWSGQPLPAALAKRSSGIFLFALPWTAFAVFWTVMATMGGGAFGFFGVPFLVIGVFMLTAPVRAARGAKQTIYAITDRRAIVIAPSDALSFGNEMSVRSFAPTQLDSLKRTQATDGSGDLIFESIVTRTNKGGTRTTHVGFLGIAHVGQVERTLKRELLASSSLPG